MVKESDVINFVLKEYEKIAEAFFDAREVTSRWVKYYLLVVAVPFSFIAFIYKDNPELFDVAKLPDTLALLLSLVGIIGFLLACIIIQSGTDSILYARTVNGLRNYYIEQAAKLNHDLRTYLILPHNSTVPKYLSFGELAQITTITGLIDSVYLGLGLTQIALVKSVYIAYITQAKLTLIIIGSILLLHAAYYVVTAKVKEKKYEQQP